mgnify:FL=1
MDGAERIAKLMDFPVFIVNWNGHPGDIAKCSSIWLPKLPSRRRMAR